jgi:cytochrome b561
MSRREPARIAAVRYDATTIALHWTTAVLVAALWIIGQTVDFWPAGPLRVDYRSVHILLGVVLGGVIVARLAWRLSAGRRLPAEGPPLMALAARAVHWGLYGLLCLAVGLGVLNAFAHGDNLFNLGRLPVWPAGPASLARQIRGWHALAANGVLILAGLHAAAALMHHHLMRDNTLRRMLPRRFAG